MIRMDKEMNKDWMDAFRERCLSDETIPSPDGWSQISRKMRHAAIRRHSALTVALLIPIAAILLWSPWRQPAVHDVPGSIPLAENTIPSESDDSFVAPEEEPIITSKVASIVPNKAKESPDIRSDETVVPNSPSVNPKNSVEPDVTNKPDEPEKPHEDSPKEKVSIESFEAISEPARRRRPRLSIGVDAGSGMVPRKTDVTLQSTPYIAALTYLNAIELPAETRGILSNYSNTVGYGVVANEFFPAFSTNHYHHDLPLSFGVTARMEMTPHLGIESGIEYTYLHSRVESAIGRLDQRLHFIGIPVRMDARLLSRGGFDLYAGVGAKAEKCLAASLGQVRCEENRIQWSAEAFAGVQYGIGNRAYLFFQPEASYYLTKTDLVTIRTEKPVSFTLHAGLRFDL
jgi:Periplasmic protein TonB, links inner and outer membranes